MREVIAAIAGHAAAAPHRMAISDARGSVTYGELLDALSRTASWAFSLPERVALMAPKDRHGIVWHLALAWAGRTIVTLPEFFSPAQLGHAIRDSGAEAVLVSPNALEAARAAGWPAVVPGQRAPAAVEAAGVARLITYTSGTTGRPKGVVLGETQVMASIRGMVEAVGAGREDRMLSVLPLALLLEQVAGMAVPLLAGASIVLCEDPRSLPLMAEAAAPTVTILVPEMLSGWVRWLEGSGRRAPASLRFVAVGGASRGAGAGGAGMAPGPAGARGLRAFRMLLGRGGEPTGASCGRNGRATSAGGEGDDRGRRDRRPRADRHGALSRWRCLPGRPPDRRCRVISTPPATSSFPGASTRSS